MQIATYYSKNVAKKVGVAQAGNWSSGAELQVGLSEQRSAERQIRLKCVRETAQPKPKLPPLPGCKVEGVAGVPRLTDKPSWRGIQ